MIHIKNMQSTGRAIKLNKVVIKLGSAVVAGSDNRLDAKALAAIADGVAELRRHGVQPILVSSGAIGMGRCAFPDFTPKTIPDRQAMAAVGQVGLMHMYKTLFNERGFRAAQMLLTRSDMEDRQRYLNARYTLERLLELDVVPVINENDTVTIDELQFGDNDELSALVAAKMNAELLVILTVVDGLYAKDPGRAGSSAIESAPIPAIERIDERTLEMAGVSSSLLGTGGMVSKLKALERAANAGVHAVIVHGKVKGIIEQIVSGQFRGTYFIPRKTGRIKGRDRWIAFGRRAAGRRLTVDLGARDALVVRKKSLLAAGIREVHGEFAPGDLVEVVDPDGKRVAKGLVNYTSDEVEKIKGKKTSQIREILGDVRYDEVIHRDYMVVF